MVDVLYRRDSDNRKWYYKPVSDAAKQAYTRFGHTNGYYPFSSDPVKQKEWMLTRGIDLTYVAEDECGKTAEGTVKQLYIHTTSVARWNTDPDGPLTPMQSTARQPHRYELLGYTPNKWGEH